ncbi:hypothetical protein JCM8097_001677 [Rhodosporidiobolus ruineniae]
MKFGLAASDTSDDDFPSDPLPKVPLDRTPRRPPSRARLQPTPSTSRAAQQGKGEEPFVPTPVRLPSARKLAASTSTHRRRPHFTSSSDLDSSPSSVDERDPLDGADTSDSEDDELDLLGEGSSEEWDSEEEAWPVGPVNSVGVRGWRRAGASGKGKGKAPMYSEPARLFDGHDEHDEWDEKSKASSWAAANRTFHLSLARSKSLSPSLAASSTSANPLTSASSSTDISSIQSLLSQLDLRQRSETAALVQSFEKRNKALWDSIEAAISAAEKEEEGRQRALAEKRAKEEEAEKQAKAMREQAERKAAEEAKKAAEEAEKRRKEDEERREKEEEERKRRADEEVKAAAKASAVGLPPSGAEGSPQAEFERWTAKMMHIKQAVLPVVSQNPAWRKACFQAKRAITPKIGQLTSSSSATLRIITHLDELLASLKPASPPTPDRPAEPYVWTLNHLAKALVKQAETEVTAKLGTAYPLGRVVVGLLTRGHTELGEVLMARLVKKCFWVTGYWPPKKPDQSQEAYQKTLGHAPPTSSESLVQYAERMAGLVALYGSILSASPLVPPQGPCPEANLAFVPPHFRPSAGWRWLVLLLRPPLVGLEPTPLLLVTFLSVAAPTLLSIYGRQFAKLLRCLLDDGVRGSKAGFAEKAKSSRVRLELWLDEWEKTGRVEEVKGRECDP